MSSLRQTLGAFGERFTAARLMRGGYRVVDRNVRLPSGEIDIVAQDAETLVFVEVRTRRNDRFGSPEESVTPAKARRLVNLGYEYVQRRNQPDRPWRIDVAALEVDHRGAVRRFELFKNAVAFA
jgi:putative endonuclease